MATVAMAMTLVFGSAPIAAADGPPTPYECPGSNAHVWDKDQCPRIGGVGIGPRGGGGAPGGGGGLLGTIGRLVGGLTGGLL